MEKTIQKFKAIGEEVRLRILVLLNRGELCVCDIENALQMSQSRISQHLLKLKNAGLISNKKVGKWKHYFLTKEGNKFLESSLFKILNSLKTDKIIKKDLNNLKKYKNTKC